MSTNTTVFLTTRVVVLHFGTSFTIQNRSFTVTCEANLVRIVLYNYKVCHCKRCRKANEFSNARNLINVNSIIIAFRSEDV